MVDVSLRDVYRPTERPDSPLNKENLMIFISKARNLTLPLWPSHTEYFPNGAVKEVTPAMVIQFGPASALPEDAIELVKKMPKFNVGLGVNVNPLSRCGVVDTEALALQQGWDEETKTRVEEALSNGAASNSLYVKYERQFPKPWPDFDAEEDLDKILYVTDLIGVSPASVLQYERLHANRSELIEALEKLANEEQEEGVVAA
jgi:hypothetical protein